MPASVNKPAGEGDHLALRGMILLFFFCLCVWGRFESVWKTLVPNSERGRMTPTFIRSCSCSNTTKLCWKTCCHHCTNTYVVYVLCQNHKGKMHMTDMTGRKADVPWWCKAVSLLYASKAKAVHHFVMVYLGQSTQTEAPGGMNH